MSYSGAIVLGAALALGAGAVSAATITETKLTATDASAPEIIGQSVAISGTTAIVGASEDQENGNGSGAAFLFDAATGTQIAKLTASDAEANDFFGASVATSGTTAIVGSYGDDGAGSDFSGAAYLFDSSTGGQIRKLTADDRAPGDYFGRSVAISGSTAIVGAYKEASVGQFSGSAYLFNTSTGDQIAKLVASDAEGFDEFGTSVAISGNTAVVGAPEEDGSGPGGARGAAYLFNTVTGAEIAKLTASDAAQSDRFGTSVAISGDIAIVGAPFDDDAGGSSGSAYLFDAATGTQIAKLTADDTVARYYFGHSVAISGNTVIVGAYEGDRQVSRNGAAFLFDISTGDQIGKLTASDARVQDRFGWSVAISGDTAVAGAYFYRNGSSDRSGSAYLYNGIEAPSAAPIPLPAGIWLMLAGLGWLAALRRRS